MPQYLLSVHSSTDAPPRPDASPEQLQAWFAAVQQLEQDLEEAGAWVFSGQLTNPGSATVVRLPLPLLTDCGRGDPMCGHGLVLADHCQRLSPPGRVAQVCCDAGGVHDLAGPGSILKSGCGVDHVTDCGEVVDVRKEDPHLHRRAAGR